MDDSELSRKECYSLVYKALIGRDRGPKVSTLITECDRSLMLNLLNSYLDGAYRQTSGLR